MNGAEGERKGKESTGLLGNDANSKALAARVAMFRRREKTTATVVLYPILGREGEGKGKNVLSTKLCFSYVVVV